VREVSDQGQEIANEDVETGAEREESEVNSTVEEAALQQVEVERLGELAAEVAELKTTLADRERLLQDLKEEAKAKAEEVIRLKNALAQAVSAYRARALAEAPELPQDMVSGDSVEEVERSLAAARELVERVRNQLKEKSEAEHVPVGTPTRRGVNQSAMSPGEKIAYGLSRKQA
jgi:hypothetical protein